MDNGSIKTKNLLDKYNVEYTYNHNDDIYIVNDVYITLKDEDDLSDKSLFNNLRVLKDLVIRCKSHHIIGDKFLNDSRIDGNVFIYKCKRVGEDFIVNSKIGGSLYCSTVESTGEYMLNNTIIGGSIYFDSLKHLPFANSLQYRYINGSLYLNSLEELDNLDKVVVYDDLYIGAVKKDIPSHINIVVYGYVDEPIVYVGDNIFKNTNHLSIKNNSDLFYELNIDFIEQYDSCIVTQPLKLKYFDNDVPFNNLLKSITFKEYVEFDLCGKMNGDIINKSCKFEQGVKFNNEYVDECNMRVDDDTYVSKYLFIDNLKILIDCSNIKFLEIVDENNIVTTYNDNSSKTIYCKDEYVVNDVFNEIKNKIYEYE